MIRINLKSLYRKKILQYIKLESFGEVFKYSRNQSILNSKTRSIIAQNDMRNSIFLHEIPKYRFIPNENNFKAVSIINIKEQA